MWLPFAPTLTRVNKAWCPILSRGAATAHSLWRKPQDNAPRVPQKPRSGDSKRTIAGGTDFRPIPLCYFANSRRPRVRVRSTRGRAAF
jgi:hypothetical protein